jgi:hypothetical protein
MVVDRDGSMDEMWPAIGAYPGFLGGVLFSIVLSIAERHRGLAELSLPRSGAWGAVAGMVIGTMPFLLGTPNSESPGWLPAVAIGSMTLMGAVSAAGSLALARRGKKREMLDAGTS